MESKALQSALGYYDVVDNQLMIAGRSAREWAGEYGTPLYLYDASVIRRKISLFRKHLPAEMELSYAVKANPNPDVLRIIAPLVDGFDVASIGEFDRVMQAGVSPQKISFAGPGKRTEELSRAISADIGSLNVESERELDLIAAVGQTLGKTPGVSIRVNPAYELHGAGMKMGGGPKQFGIDEEIVPSVLARIDALQVDFRGFHIFTGAQNLNADAICATLEKSFELAARLSGSRAQNVSIVNLGGGFGIPYFEKDEPLNLERIGASLKELLKEHRPHFPNARFVIELGRFLVGEAGVYLTRVLYKKMSRGRTFVVTDGGMNQHLAASGNLGQVLRKNYPIVNVRSVSSAHETEIELVGPLCTPLDLLGARLRLSPVEEGDVIAIMNSGAYGYTASPLLFLSHPSPKEALAL